MMIQEILRVEYERLSRLAAAEAAAAQQQQQAHQQWEPQPQPQPPAQLPAQPAQGYSSYGTAATTYGFPPPASQQYIRGPQRY